jgi:hypothetical protein
MKMAMAKREPGMPIIAPAVIHWKAGHFAALVCQRPLKTEDF